VNKQEKGKGEIIAICGK